ncbi:MAG TPA: helix-turn-helix transcriptional regulator [Pyrinomonadaceae bacterium]|jgi:transcriptional regulator with XRE-family HTH domain|nr:helix-turn-helix transcriptional regulator [Pyrinomonadaceae bacterium]
MRIDTEGLYLYVGIELRKARKAFGATQSEVADAAGLKQHSISKIEAGKQRISLDKLYDICVYLNLDPQQVLPTITHVTTSPAKREIFLGGTKVNLTLQEAEKSVKKLNELLGRKRKQES